MMTNRLNEDKFDLMLARALQRHSEPTPADFAERMMTAIEQAEQQRILAAVVLQQRLALAATVLFGVITIIAVVLFPAAIAGVFRTITGAVGEQTNMWLDRIPQAVETVRSRWQFYTVLAAVFGFAVYSLMDLLLGDRLQTA
jgi:hypothetical protein